MTTHGWHLLQLAELLRTIEQHVDLALRTLRDVDPELTAGGPVTLALADVDDVRAVVVEIAQLAERAELLAELLATDDGLEIAHDELAAAAARELAAGILDVDRARLAFRVLSAADGWRALAEGLRTTDAHGSWDDLTIMDALGAFRDASLERVRDLAAAAGLSPATGIASCDPDEIARLAACLDEHAPRA